MQIAVGGRPVGGERAIRREAAGRQRTEGEVVRPAFLEVSHAPREREPTRGPHVPAWAGQSGRV